MFTIKFPTMRLLFIVTVITSFATQAQEFDPLSFFSETEIELANTAADRDYLTDDEKEIFLYNNLARMWPKKFHKLYVAFCHDTGRGSYLETDHYYTTLSDDLLNRQPSGPLMPDRIMFESAECWAVESGELGIVGHDRVTCKGGYSGENCSYGYSDGLDIVMQLLIDYSVESLGHRKNMLNPGWRGMGTAIRPHSGYRFCAVQNFTGTNDELRAEAERKRIERKAEEAERQRLLEIRAGRFDELMAEWTDEEKQNADVARNFDYLTDFEKEFYFYLNLARLYPKKFKKLLLEEGPYFDRFKEEQTELRRSAGYRTISQFLGLVIPKEPFLPKREYIEAGRCVDKKWKAGQNSTSCLPGPGSWRLMTYNPDTVYNDIMSMLLDEKDQADLFNFNAHLIVVEGDYQNSKVFLR